MLRMEESKPETLTVQKVPSAIPLEYQSPYTSRRPEMPICSAVVLGTVIGGLVGVLTCALNFFKAGDISRIVFVMCVAPLIVLLRLAIGSSRPFILAGVSISIIAVSIILLFEGFG